MRTCFTAIGLAFVVAAAPAAAQEAETVNKSLVRVIAFKDGRPVMIATGFAIGDKGHVVTADHVVTAGEVRVLRDGEPNDMARARPGKVLVTNKATNLAIIEVANLGAPGLAFSTEMPKQGMRIFLFGYPGGEATNSTLTSGIVSQVAMRDAGGRQAQFTQHDARGGPGTGGGPIVNACGAVVGVNGFLMQSGAGLGVTAVEVADAARAHNVTWATAPACTR